MASSLCSAVRQNLDLFPGLPLPLCQCLFEFLQQTQIITLQSSFPQAKAKVFSFQVADPLKDSTFQGPPCSDGESETRE